MNMIDLKHEIITYDFLNQDLEIFKYLGRIEVTRQEMSKYKELFLQYSHYCEKVEFVYEFGVKAKYYIKVFPLDLESAIKLFNLPIGKYLFRKMERS